MAKYRVETDNGIYEVETDEVDEVQATPSKLESAVRAGAQGVTLGHADELTASLESLFTDKPYEQSRDESRAAYDAAEKANPKTSIAANIVGSIPPYIAATALTANPVAGPAIAGAIQGEGESDAPLMSAETVKDAAVGGVIGAATGKMGDVVANKLGSKALQKTAEMSAAKTLHPTPTQTAEMGEQGMRRMGRAMLDTKAITPLGGADDITKQVDTGLEKYGQKIGKFLKKATKTGELLTSADLTSALDDAQRAITNGRTGGYYDEVAHVFDKAKKTVLGGRPEWQPLTFETINQIKGILQKAAPYKGTATDLVDRAHRATAKSVLTTLDDALNKISGSPAFQKNKATYGGLLDADQLARRQWGRETVQPILTAQEARIGTMGVVAGQGSLGVAAAATGVWKTLSKFGNQNTALAADWLAKNEVAAMKSLGKYGPALIRAAKQSPNALAVHMYVLSQQDPEFRMQMENAQKEGE